MLKAIVFLPAIPLPSRLKSMLLRLFGAKVGDRVVWKPRVNVHFPWKLSVGDDCWIGEEVFICNFEPVSIGNNCCLSQRTFICAGNHDYRRPDMAYRNAPIHLKDGVWIGAQTFVGPGTVIGVDSVVIAGSIVTRSLADGMVCQGNPCAPVRPRWRASAEPAP